MAAPLGRSTVGRRLAAIFFAHRAAGLDPPTVQPDATRLDKALRVIRRDKRYDAAARKRPADGDMLRAIDGDSLRAHRDRALPAIGVAGAFRRSELVAISFGHVAEDARGLTVGILSSKTDQERRGHSIAVPDGRRPEPIRHCRVWLTKPASPKGGVPKLTPQGRLAAGAMSAQGAALVFKAAALAAGYPPELFADHSLRAGFLTETGRQNANLFKMREHSRHALLEMVVDYVRDHERFRETAGEGFL